MIQPQVIVPLLDGFEEIEAITIIDVLRRAEVAVTIASDVAGPVRGAHDIYVSADAALADLEAELKQRTHDNPELELSIRADTEAPWGQIIKLMDAAKAAGITSVKAFTEEPADG